MHLSDGCCSLHAAGRSGLLSSGAQTLCTVANTQHESQMYTCICGCKRDSYLRICACFVVDDVDDETTKQSMFTYSIYLKDTANSSNSNVKNRTYYL